MAAKELLETWKFDSRLIACPLLHIILIGIIKLNFGHFGFLFLGLLFCLSNSFIPNTTTDQSGIIFAPYAPEIYWQE
jgi:hypothetical protein